MLNEFDVLQDAIEQYNPRYVIALFSGGHDSLVATHVASRHPKFSFALHLNTGIGVRETRDFVHDTCKSWGIELREYKASEYMGADGTPDAQIYRDLVLEQGFPGPAMHHKMFQRLKERPLRQAIRDLDRLPSDKTLLVSGRRRDESERRMRMTKPIETWEGTKVFCSPIWRFTKSDIYDYIEKFSLDRNEVADKLHGSKECLCGAFAHDGEMEELRLWYPEAAAEILSLQEEVMRKFPWGWGERPPANWRQEKAGQLCLLENVLCSSCLSSA